MGNLDIDYMAREYTILKTMQDYPKLTRTQVEKLVDKAIEKHKRRND